MSEARGKEAVSVLVRVTLRQVCCGVEVDADGRIRRTAPVLKRFVGQSLASLTHWVLKQGGSVERL